MIAPSKASAAASDPLPAAGNVDPDHVTGPAAPEPLPPRASSENVTHRSEPPPSVAPSRATAPIGRGIGMIAGVACAAALGASDGIAAIVRSPAGTLTTRSAVLVLLHTMAVLATFGFAIGAVQELLLAAARRRPALVALGRRVTDGAGRWFARDPRAALGVFSTIFALCLAIAPVLPVTYFFIKKMHGHFLMASAIFLFTAFMIAVAAAVTLVLAWPLGWVFDRIGRFASPGAVIVLAVLVVAAQGVRFVVINYFVFRAVDGAPAALVGAAIVVDLGVLVAGGTLLRRRGRPVRSRTLGILAALSVTAFFISGFTFGSRQSVASTIFLRSEVTGGLVRVLQHAIDLDHDGYGALFGGGDCNDHNARIHPGARDVPGNGIDENCTGADARPEEEVGDGHYNQVSGPLANMRPSFVFLSIDAMRPDHVGAYGYNRPTTPHIDAFARDAARFVHAYCTSPRSLRSFSSIWTGRYPSMIEWGQDNQFPDLLDDNVTLAEQLAAAGYVSAGFNNADYFHRTNGFFQGFNEWHEASNAEWKADINVEVNNVLGFLNMHGNDMRPFFLWAHMMEPHDAYRRWTDLHDFGTRPVDDYDSEIAHADQALGRILPTLDALAARRPIVVVLFSDHGESFGEHGYNFHSSDLHEEQSRVTLLVRGPGIAPGVRNALVSLMDLNPTLLNYIGRPEQRPVDARSLVGVLQDPNAPFAGNGWRDHLFMEVTPDGLIPYEQKALLAPPYKIIYDVYHQVWQLYDVSRDPPENHNLIDDDHDLAGRMRERLMSWVDVAELPGNRSDEIIARARMTAPPAHMDIPLHVRFGDVVELLGADMPTRIVHVGDVFRVVLYLRVLRQTSTPFWFHVLFQPEDGGGTWGHFAASHYPVGGRYPTTHWIPGEIIRDEVPMRLEPEVRTTAYALRLKVQEDNWGQILSPSVQNDNGVIPIGRFEVQPQ